MFVRLALDHEEDEFVRLAVADLTETMPGEPFDEDVLRQTFRRYLETSSPTIFFAEHDRRVIGMVMSHAVPFDHRAGFYVTQRVLYVLPENRGTRAAVILMRHLVQWAEQTGAAEIAGGNDNSFNSDRTAAFLAHFGFEKVGYAMVKRLEEREHG